jgi:hypothetical protein
MDYKLPVRDSGTLLEMGDGRLNWKKILSVLWEQDECNSTAARWEQLPEMIEAEYEK